ncbi:hypothetical protein Fmac_012341 [Flemingia macrophylla]|uniref:Uncharacterized protein n=1 Tax=Flemingia macrophylla TaxID=520843 RepID=A0ABD1MS43_9FABA
MREKVARESKWKRGEVDSGDLVEEADLDSFNLPVYLPTMDEVKQLIETERFLILQTLKTFKLRWVAVLEEEVGDAVVDSDMRAAFISPRPLDLPHRAPPPAKPPPSPDPIPPPTPNPIRTEAPPTPNPMPPYGTLTHTKLHRAPPPWHDQPYQTPLPALERPPPPPPPPRAAQNISSPPSALKTHLHNGISPSKTTWTSDGV